MCADLLLTVPLSCHCKLTTYYYIIYIQLYWYCYCRLILSGSECCWTCAPKEMTWVPMKALTQSLWAHRVSTRMAIATLKLLPSTSHSFSARTPGLTRCMKMSQRLLVCLVWSGSQSVSLHARYHYHVVSVLTMIHLYIIHYVSWFLIYKL